MTGKSSWYDQLGERAVREARIIVDAFGERGIEIGGASDPADEDEDLHANGIAYMYAKDHILTRERHLGGIGGIQGVQSVLSASRQRGVLEVLQQHGITNVEVRRIVDDIVLLRLNPPQAGPPGDSQTSRTSDDQTPDGDNGSSEGDRGTAQGERPDARYLLDRIDAEFGAGIATPDHVLTAAQIMNPCSAKEPEPVPPTEGPDPALCPDGGVKVRIFVADTGLVFGAAPWLAGVHGDPDPGNRPDGVILPYGGHGTFVTGVLRCIAPESQVHVANIFDTAGSALESEVVTRLTAASGFGFEILHLTASCMTRLNIPLLALEAWLEQLTAYQGVVCIAPAGNNRTRRPSWPGAFPNVISVGALAANRHDRAEFSDYGGWVDVYAPGEDLVNAFGSGRYTYQVTPGAGEATFSGLARWSGTSFSAPIVTGLIAARMARRDESAEEAAGALLARARAQRIAGTGPVLLPSCGDEDD